jgi:hypothetical protein
MSSLGRKLARQNKRNTPEGKEQLKQEKAEKQAAQPPQNLASHDRIDGANVPHTRIRQRRSGSG